MQKLSWYANRLSLMSVGEVAWRARQSVLRFAYLFGARPVPAPCSVPARIRPWLAPAAGSFDAILASAERIIAGQFCVFDLTTQRRPELPFWCRDPRTGVVAPVRPGPLIDYRDVAVVGDARYVWELNRHFHLVSLGQAWQVTKDDRFARCARELIASWLNECPYPVGVNWASALELGIRLVNWYLASRLFEWWSTADEPVTGWRDSIYRHCKFIEAHRSRYSSANNHLIGEMMGLYVASSVWPYWPESDRWRRESKQILCREVALQVHADGVGREQSVDYQVFVAQMLLIAGLVGEHTEDEFSQEYWETIQKMLGFVAAITDSAGRTPSFGDSDDGMVYMLGPESRESRARDLLAVKARFDADRGGPSQICDTTPGWISAGFLAPRRWVPLRETSPTQFPQGGYCVLADRRGTSEEVLVVVDVAPLGYLSIAAHGHADCLSIVMSLGGAQLLVDPGTFSYHGDDAWREYFRGTSAHNTVRVDFLDQSQQVGPFMWSRKAVPVLEHHESAGSVQVLAASHDGYERLSDPVRHRREIRFDKGACQMTVSDTIQCNGAHIVERFWHVGEDWNVKEIGGGTFHLSRPGCLVTLESSDSLECTVNVGSASPVSGWLSRRYGSKFPIPTIAARTNVCGTKTVVTNFSWRFQ